MFDISQFATPQQMQAIALLREKTKDIKARIVVQEGQIQVQLEPQSEEAKQYLGSISEALVNSIGTTLNTFFGITGTIKKIK